MVSKVINQLILFFSFRKKSRIGTPKSSLSKRELRSIINNKGKVGSTPDAIELFKQFYNC